MTGESGARTTEGRRLLEVLGLTGLAVAQPVLDVMGRSPETFVFRGVDGAELVLFALAVALVPGVVLWALGLATGLLGARVRAAVHLVTLGGLAAVAVLAFVRAEDWLRGPAALLVAMAAGALVGWLAARRPGVRLVFAYLSPLPLLAAGAFLVISPTADLVTGDEVAVEDDIGATTPVVMLVLDEVPTASLLDAEGNVDGARFPNLARLGQSSTWFRNFTTVNNFTTHAVPALVTGREPERDDSPVFEDHPDNLFTLLGGSHDLDVLESVTQLCPTSLCDVQRTPDGGLRTVLGDAADVFRDLISLEAVPDPPTDTFVEEVTLEDRPTRFEDFLDALEDDGPTLDYLHLVLPHEPYRFFPDGTEYRPPPRDPPGDPDGIWEDAWPAQLSRLRFELQARYTDALVGQFLDRIEGLRLWDEAVIVVVADHGASFIPGEGRRLVTDGNAHEILGSALFVRAPGLDPGVTDANVQSLDLLPTVADLIGAEIPWPVDGVTAVGRDEVDGEKRYYQFATPYRPEPDAVLRFESTELLDDLLTDERPIFDPDDPVGSLYRSTPHADLYDRPVVDLAVGDPLDTEPDVDSTDGAFVSGVVGSEAVADDDWIVVAVDGVVAGMSPLYREEERDRAFAVLLDQDRLGGELELFAVGSPGEPLRPFPA
jgi:hypothetical protein